MCRHLAYVGPPTSLTELLLEPEHSLLEQTWAPRDMRDGGTINADGFGVGWLPAEGGAPAAYRMPVPMWTDAAFPRTAETIRSGAVLGAIRSATVGMPVTQAACAPFTDENWMFSHNGKVPGWPDSMAKHAARLDVVDLLTLEAPTDSALLWALLRQRMNQGQDPAEATAALVTEIAAEVPEARLNLLLTDGDRIIATTWTHSLWVRRLNGAVIVSSEPFGNGQGWTEVPDRSLLVADIEHVLLTPLPEQEPA